MKVCVLFLVLVLLIVLAILVANATAGRSNLSLGTTNQVTGGGSTRFLDWSSLADLWTASQKAGVEVGGWFNNGIVWGEAHRVAMSPPKIMAFHTHPTHAVEGKVTEFDRFSPPSGCDVMESIDPKGDPAPSLVVAERAFWLIETPAIPPSKKDATEWYLQLLKWEYSSGLYGDDVFSATDTYVQRAAKPEVDFPPDFLAFAADQFRRSYERPDLAALCDHPPRAEDVAPVTLQYQLR